MPSNVGLPSSSALSQIISGSRPARRCMPVFSVNAAWISLRLLRQSAVRYEPPSSRSSRPRKQVHHTRATFVSHGSTWNVSGSGRPTSSAASGP